MKKSQNDKITQKLQIVQNTKFHLWNWRDEKMISGEQIEQAMKGNT